MPNNENLNWLLTVNGDTSGAEKFNKALKDSEASLGAVDVATSKTERAMESAGARAAKMGDDVAKSTKRYVSELMTAGVPMERLQRLAKTLGESESDAAHVSVDAHGRSRAAAEGHAEGFKGIGHAVEETKRSVIGFGEAIGAILAFEVFKEGLGIIREVGSEILKIAGDTQRLERSFTFRFGVEGGEEALAYADRFARATEFSDDQSKQFVSQLGRAGVAVRDLDVYMAASADLAAMSGDKINGMGTAIDALSRAKLTGIIDTRELRMLGIGVEQLKTLPEYARKSKEELHDLMKSGSITEDQLLTIVQKQGPDSGKLGDMANAMSTTLSARMEKVFNLPEQYIQKLSKSASLETLSGKFGEVLTALDPDGPRGAAIFGSLERSFEKFVGIVAKIDFEKVANTIENEILPAVETIVSEVAKIDWVGNAKELYGYLKDAKDIIGPIIDGMRIATRFIAHPLDTVSEIASTGEVDLKKSHQTTAKEANENAGLHVLGVAERNHVTDADSYDPLAASLAKNVARRSDVFGLGGGRPKSPSVEYDPSRPETGESMLPAVRAVEDVSIRAAAGAGKDQARFEAAGKDASAGYIRGLLAGAPSAEEAGGDMGNRALAGTAAAQDSHSPSRKFARLGGDAVDGYTDALEDGSGDAARAGAGLAKAGLDGADSVPSRARREAMGLGPFGPGATAPADDAPSGDAAPTFAPPSPPARDGRSVTITIPITISVGGGADGGDADEAVDRLQSRLPGALTSALEQLGIEAGL